jgi:hypothetical protein
MRDLLLTTRIWVRGTWLALRHPRLLIGYRDDRRRAGARSVKKSLRARAGLERSS